MTQAKRKGPTAATMRPRSRKGKVIKLVRIIARNWQDIKTGLGLLMFLLMVGVAGGIDNEMIPLDAGFGIMAACLIAMWLLIRNNDEE